MISCKLAIYIRKCYNTLTASIGALQKLIMRGVFKVKATESIENYLETILILSKEKYDVHSIEIATTLGFSKPSVSVAMKNLRQKNLIIMDKDNHIYLTEEGREIAEKIYERHLLLSRLLMSLGVSEKTALEDACRIEHDISEESFSAIKAHVNQYSK